MNASLGMGLTIASKLEGECLGSCGVGVAQWSEHWLLKSVALGSIPGGCPDVFSSSTLSDVDVICGALVQFGCYHHRDMDVYVCMVLDIPLRVLGTPLCQQAST